jgi:hypothetical protein
VISARHHSRWGAMWHWIVDRWNRTPGYLKWAGGILAGALARFLLEKFFPDVWANISRVFLDPKIPVWVAVVALILILVLERTTPSLYRRWRTKEEPLRLRSIFGVRWATPPEVEEVQGPFCVACTVTLRGVLWSGDSSPTLWLCPSCGREYSTPEFPDIRREVERMIGVGP